MPTNTRQQEARQAPTPARIRIPNSMVTQILNTSPERPTLDVLQAQLLRLDETATSQADRILVTHSEDTLDLLRDWCTRLIADYRLSDEPHAKALVAQASKVIGFMDNHESRAERAARHPNGNNKPAVRHTRARKGTAKSKAAATTR